MRSLLVPSLLALILLVLLVPPASAQRSGVQPCDAGAFGTAGGFGGSRNGTFNGTPRDGAPPNGTFGNGTRGGPNGAGGARGQGPFPELNITFDPAGPLSLAPGDSAIVVATLRNSGASTIHLNLTTARPNGSATPQNVSATLDLAALAIGPGGSATATLTVHVDPATPRGCAGMVALLAREVGSNRTANARLLVDVPAEVAGTSQAADPTSSGSTGATAAASDPASVAQKTTPGTPLAFALAMIAAVALRRRR